MIRAIRRSRLLTLLAVFALFTALPASLSLWHDEGDDPYCAPPPVFHDHSAHRFEPAERAQPATADHCLLCHWAQSSRVAVATRFVLPEAPSALLLWAEVSPLATTTTAGSAGRAPPALA